MFYSLSPRVTSFSTTRLGGCSTGKYASMNINHYCGDDEEHIAQNLNILAQKTGVSPNHIIVPHQVHGTTIRQMGEEFLHLSAESRRMTLEGVDALITNVCGICIGVSTADCIPVLVYDPEHHASAAIHAGWRGTVQRITQLTIQAMCRSFGSQPQSLRAVIGPGISLDAFEVGDEVYEAFATAGFHMPAISLRKDKWHIDLPECNRQQLIAAGLPKEHITNTGICTYHHADTYFSARRLGIQSGRIYSGIILH